MRILFTVLIVLVFCESKSQSMVKVIFNQTMVSTSDSLDILLILEESVEIEVAVFSDKQLFAAERSQPIAGRIDYKFPLTGIKPGRYTLLVTSESFNEEFEFIVTE